ncbi:nuclease SbcCD subunit C-like isoform X2 [Harmonia axyridis]|uniref:nuclease SbcCD subunit C-like isoform X2 n=1 Tax=Harmonia axyridis TaxID=115357 RepID=UPI001E27561A|nr:nuclease SbcCD subunit C-like isoform X2 [Harmonia axyridis]
MEYTKQDFLLISLTQDLKCLDGILDNIYQNMKNYKLKSWLFPQKYVDECRDLYPPYNEKLTYVKCLEMMVEKLYIMLNFLNQRKASDRKRRNVHYPTRITLGRCAQKFWELINSEEDEKAILNPTNSSTNLIINKECQTNIQSMIVCDSCFEMNEFMKDIIKFISENFEESSTKHLLRTMNETICSATKFGGILKFTNSLKQDYHNLINKLNEKSEENNILSEEKREIKIIIDNMEMEIEELNVSNYKITEDLMNSRKEVATLNDKIKNIEKEKENLQQNCDTYELLNDNLTNQVKYFEQEHIENEKKFSTNLENYEEILAGRDAEIANYKITNNNLFKNSNDLKIKYEELICKYSKMCTINKKLEQSLEDINYLMKAVDNITEKTLLSVKKLTDRSKELNEKIESVRKKYSEENTYTNKFYKTHKIH